MKELNERNSWREGAFIQILTDAPMETSWEPSGTMVS